MCTAPDRPGNAARNCSTVAVIAKLLPAYRYPSTARSTVGEIWVNRSITDPGPKSGEHDDQTPPRADVARKPTSAWIPLGTSAATRSPAPTPSRRSPSCAAPTRRRRSASVTCSSVPSSRDTITAGSDVRTGVRAGQRVFGVVQRAARKPLRTGHHRRGQHPLRRPMPAHREIIRDRGPEALQIRRRIRPQRPVVGQVPTAAGRRERGELGDPGAGRCARGWAARAPRERCRSGSYRVPPVSGVASTGVSATQPKSLWAKGLRAGRPVGHRYRRLDLRRPGAWDVRMQYASRWAFR